ncbi:glycine cleavage system H protein [Spirochaetota bacterium]|nr:glycine cleavage system H protein [Spirochaetota bacterium]
MKYTKTHEWIKEADDDCYTVGITDHAQNQLSDVVYVEIPEIGKKIEAGKSMLAIDSVKAASDIYAPIDGEIVAVNEALQDQPALVNTDPEGEGWLVKIKSAGADLSGLLTKDSYDALVKSEG